MGDPKRLRGNMRKESAPENPLEFPLRRATDYAKCPGYQLPAISLLERTWFLICVEPHNRSGAICVRAYCPYMATTRQIVFMNQASKPREEREIIGQFLTPTPTADLLAASFAEIREGQQIRLLDPGAGAGALTVAFVKRALRYKPSSILVTEVESDETILPQLRQTMRYVSQMAEGAGIIFESAIHHSDFLALVVGTEDLFTEKRLEPTFTHAILNPPYKKISTDGKERKLLSRIGIEVSNIYAGFVALSLKLLVDGGELVAITPRSFCNGPYFKAFRHFLLH